MAARDVVFISGWGGTENVWKPLIESMRQSGLAFTPHFFDWREGLGSADKLLAFISNCATKPMLCGWSLGGLLGLQAVATGADVAAVMMIASTARMCTDGEAYPGADVRAIKAMRLKLRKKPDEVLEDFSHLCFADNYEKGRQDYLEQACAMENKDLLAGLNALAEMDLREELSSVTCPLHFFHAKDDNVIPFASIEALQRIAPAITLHTFDTGGHALPVSCVEKLTRGISSVLA